MAAIRLISFASKCHKSTENTIADLKAGNIWKPVKKNIKSLFYPAEWLCL